MKMKPISKFYTSLILIFLYAPIIVLIVFSFNAEKSTSVMEGFSFRWYRELFRNEAIMDALKRTLIVASISSVVATILGTAAAVGIDKITNKWFKSATLSVTNIPMMNPDIVTGVSMMLMFVFVGRMFGQKSILGFYTLVISHITFNLPYVILSVLPKLKQTDKHLSEAAQDLGCTPIGAFFRVVLPSIFPGILTGMMMSFTLSLDDFIISNFTTDTYQTLPIYIYSMTKKNVSPDINALSTLIFLSILFLLVLINITQNKMDERMKNQKSL